MLIDNIEVQTHLGTNPSTGWEGWKLEDWDILTCAKQLRNKLGIYCIQNKLTLNFHNINYFNFKPYKTRNNKINKYLS